MIELASSLYRHASIFERLRSDRLLPSWRDLFSVECLFVAFLFSGVFKMLPELSFLPFDLTVFCFAATLAAYVWAFLAGRLHFRFGAMEFLVALLSVLAWISERIGSACALSPWGTQLRQCNWCETLKTCPP
jgi:ABC-type uncharacterized transport system permease subunit